MNQQFEYEENRGFLQRFGFPLGVVVVLAIGIFVLRTAFSGSGSAPVRRAPELVMIHPQLLPPPPPPPPPPTTPVPKEEMMEQTPLSQQDAKPEPKAAPSPALGTNVQGSGGPDGFGLGRNGGGFVGGSGGGGGSRFGWYAREVDDAIGRALRTDDVTRDATFDVRVRVWADGGGRISRVKLVQSTGSVALDAALGGRLLDGLQLPDPPPQGMPMPIVMRLIARRPES